jgi:hypothetical protein
MNAIEIANIINKEWGQPLLKADVSDPLRGPRETPDDKKLSAKLLEFAALMVKVDPSKTQEQHSFVQFDPQCARQNNCRTLKQFIQRRYHNGLDRPRKSI